MMAKLYFHVIPICTIRSCSELKTKKLCFKKLFCFSHLHLHGLFDTRWNVYIFDFVTKATDSPLV